MQKKGKIGLSGEFTFKIFDKDGNFKKKIIYKNKILKAARTKIADRLTNPTPDSDLLINYIAVGTGTNIVADTDTQLQTELVRKQVTSRTHSDDVASISTTFAAGEATGTLKEAAVIIEGTATADSGIFLSRVNVDITVDALDSLFIDWRITVQDA